MLAQRLRRWPNIEPALSERLVFAGIVIKMSLFCRLFYHLTLSARGPFLDSESDA